MKLVPNWAHDTPAGGVKSIDSDGSSSRLGSFRISRRERTTREQDPRFQRFFESNMIGIGIWRTDGRFEDANDALLDLLGATRAELEGGRLNWRSMTPTWFADEDARALDELAICGTVSPYEKAFRRLDGGIVPVLVAGTRWEDHDDTGVFIIVDYSEPRSHLEAQRFLAEAGAVLASSLDVEVTIERMAWLAIPTYADFCFVDLLHDDGVVERMVVAHADPEFSPDAQAWRRRRSLRSPRVCAIARTIRSKRPLLLTHDDPHDFETAGLGDLLELPHQGVKSFMTLPMTIRERAIGVLTMVSTREIYGESNLTCATELAQRAAVALDNAMLFREARAAIRVREDFLSIASHELKTPLSSLQLQLERLSRSLAHEPQRLSPTQIQASLDLALQQVRRQAQLIDNLLDASRISEGRLQQEPTHVDMADVLSEAIARLTEDIVNAGSTIEVRCDAPVFAFADRSRIDQVLTNVLSNAVKYGDGKPIDVVLSQAGNVARVAVRDRGIGIAPTSRARIFDRFERAVPHQNYTGFGLGLWISRRLVESMGGAIDVESSVGAGSTFVITLPAAVR